MEDVAPQDVLQIKLAGLELWVRGRQSMNSPKYEDDDWLSVTARCRASGADVSAAGLIFHLSAIERWRDQIRHMQQSLSGKAILSDLEQHLTVELMSLSLGHIEFKVEITPDHLTQQHSFKFEIDQSYLARLLVQCGAVVAEYPIRGQRAVKA